MMNTFIPTLTIIPYGINNLMNENLTISIEEFMLEEFILEG